MEKLKKHPELCINQVANRYGCKTEELRDSQLSFLKSVLKRDSKNWEVAGYGK